MHIIHVVRQFHPAVGGLENVVWELANQQLARGHDVRVVTLDRTFPSGRKLPARETVGELEIVRVPFAGSARYPIAPSVLRHVRDADIVHVHGLDFFFDYLACTMPLHRRKLVVSTHGAFFHTAYAARLKRLYFSTITRLSLSCYAGVATVGVSDDRLFSKIRSRGIALIENGINLAKYAGAAAPSPTKSIITVGRFSANKRLDRLIRFLAALRRHDPQWTLRIAGRAWDHSADELERLSEAAGVRAAVEVLESPSDREIADLMQGCSVFASASEYEGFGVAAVEGMSAGLFPILNDISPFRRVVERARLGMTLDFSNPEAAARAFAAAWPDISADYADRRQAAMAASAIYSWSRVSEQYEALYASALGTSVRSILDVPIDVTTFPEAAARLDDRFHHGDPAMVVFANAHTLNSMRPHEHVRAALRRSIVFNDGIGIDIASRILFGRGFPENLNGTDFVPRYLRRTANSYRIFLLGAKPGVARRAAEQLARLAPQHRVVGYCHGYLAGPDRNQVADEIRQAQADILLVAMGDPQQELWLAEHLNQTGCRLGFCVGALFDFMGGTVQRAPQWARAAHLEWLYRMMQEPRRLWRRYLIGMPVFLVRVAGQWLAGARVSRVLQE